MVVVVAGDGGEGILFFLSSFLYYYFLQPSLHFFAEQEIVYPLSLMTLLRTNCLTPVQLLVMSKCYLNSYHLAVVISQDVWI